MPADQHVSPDGSPLAVYLALPAGDAPTLVSAALPTGAGILELGSGPGRLTRVLLALGHPVIAVDDHPAMLAPVTGAETVVGDAWSLALDRTVDAVRLRLSVIASTITATPDGP